MTSFSKRTWSEIDLNAVQEELERLDMEDKEVTEELNKYLRELGLKELK